VREGTRLKPPARGMCVFVRGAVRGTRRPEGPKEKREGEGAGVSTACAVAQQWCRER